MSVLRFCPWYNNFLEEKSVAEYSADFIKSVLLGHAHILWGVWFSWTFEWLTYWHAHLCKVNFKVLWSSICRRKVKSTHRSVCARRAYCCGIYLIYHEIPTSSSQYQPNHTWSSEFKIISITWFFKQLTFVLKKTCSQTRIRKRDQALKMNISTTSNHQFSAIIILVDIFNG